jgi:hypothetical protein
MVLIIGPIGVGGAQMFFGMRINSAIAQLGIRPAVINSDYRRSMQSVGKVRGNSPQEVALLMVAQLPLMHRGELPLAIIKTWIRKRKIDQFKRETRYALEELGLFELC